MDPLLVVEGLTIEVPDGHRGWLRVIDDVSFELHASETLGFVGESGSGKTMTALSLLGLTPPGSRVRARRMRLDGTDLTSLNERGWSAVRGGSIGMVFQDALSGLNPVRTVGSILMESVRRHQGVGKTEARTAALAALEAVHIPEPESRLSAYPHQLSGGMRQRVMIALATVNRPRVIIADEPTTALDATIQAQILELLQELVASSALILITHDLGVASSVCDRIAVIYSGRFAEVGPGNTLLHDTRHPYTSGLLNAVPRFERRRRPLVPIQGSPPSVVDQLPGCAFAPRCPHRLDRCSIDRPLLEADGEHLLACWNPIHA